MKCDDIRVLYHDKDIIFTLIEKYPDKSITLFRYYHHETEEIDWNEIENYKILTKNNFLFGVSSISDLISCV